MSSRDCILPTGFVRRPAGSLWVQLAIGGLLAAWILPGCKSEKTPPPTSSGTGSSTNSAAKPLAPTSTGTSQTGSGNSAPVTDTEPAPGVKPGSATPLNPQGTVLLDVPGKRVFLKAKIALPAGPLELLCCKKQTKEHESIFSVDTQAYLVQTALITLGAKTGRPARHEPTYQPASGQRIDIFVLWNDAQGKLQRVRAREWVRYLTQKFYVAKFPKLPAGIKLPEPSELRYDSVTQELSWYGMMKDEQRDKFLALSTDAEFKKAIQKFYDDSRPQEMTADWVFVGSGFQKRSDGKEVFLAEDGDLICVSNFSNAVIDVNLNSSASNESLLFEAYTERIPPKGTTVTLELVPLFAEPSPRK